MIVCWHFLGPQWRHRIPTSPAYSESPLPKYWSVSGKSSLEGVTDFKKLANLSVVALVFYGRPPTVSLLDCYLKRNLVENGGILDQVIWLARTKKEEDLEWLDALVDTSPSYTRHNLTFEDKDYRSAYDIIQNGTMYVKIDDDIVFFEDTTIPSLVSTRLQHPEYFIVSANIMNQPSLSWVHQHLGAIKPYLPEIEPPLGLPYIDSNSSNYNFTTSGNWRASELPVWDGPYTFNYTDYFLQHPNGPNPGHRWLPLETFNTDGTPIMDTAYDAFSQGLWQWQIAAQEHYSFFDNLEKNELYKYKVHMWDYNYARMGIQFVAMMGEDINLSKPIEEEDDEYYFSEVMPYTTRRHGIVDGRAMAAHYSFEPQREGIGSTDILDRYRAYARENICF
ncbi:hypothetical protein EJ08DRAFT_577628 [Tothia fuscella]|uniref:Uncharacterized protein n=1 Tax=Tothia fuscella TaxID=1048955 RepID=A0A9P4P2M4_9PEZI|nr:hypothetical protein EJ08DRAFT_577628 [Tothia fuscella]